MHIFLKLPGNRSPERRRLIQVPNGFKETLICIEAFEMHSRYIFLLNEEYDFKYLFVQIFHLNILF